MRKFNKVTRDILNIVARLCGLILLLIGLWIAIQVFNEALDLYRNPGNIERIALAIEQGSNIDKGLAQAGEDLPEDVITQAEQSPTNDDIRISYFVAWVIEFLLLLLLARISLMAIKTGGELVLYDARIRHLTRKPGNKDRE